MLPRGNASVRVPQAEKRRAHMAGLGGFLSEADHDGVEAHPASEVA